MKHHTLRYCLWLLVLLFYILTPIETPATSNSNPTPHNRMANGLFHVNVRPGFDRGDSRQCMPVVRRARYGNIRLFLLKQLAVILVFFGFVAGKLFRFFRCGIQLPLVHVAQSNHFAPAGFNRLTGDIHAPPATAYPDVNPTASLLAKEPAKDMAFSLQERHRAHYHQLCAMLPEGHRPAKRNTQECQLPHATTFVRKPACY